MVEIPLTINIISGHSSKAHSENSRLSGSMQGTSITIQFLFKNLKDLMQMDQQVAVFQIERKENYGQ